MSDQRLLPIGQGMPAAFQITTATNEYLNVVPTVDVDPNGVRATPQSPEFLAQKDGYLNGKIAKLLGVVQQVGTITHPCRM